MKVSLLFTRFMLYKCNKKYVKLGKFMVLKCPILRSPLLPSRRCATSTHSRRYAHHSELISVLNTNKQGKLNMHSKSLKIVNRFLKKRISPGSIFKAVGPLKHQLFNKIFFIRTAKTHSTGHRGNSASLALKVWYSPSLFLSFPREKCKSPKKFLKFL